MRLEQDPSSRGVRAATDSLTFVPADVPLRPLGDRLIIEALETVYSRTIEVLSKDRPLRGRVLAAGRGCYPKVYDHSEKAKRTQYREGYVFRPCAVKVGDIVELGGAQYGGYAFEQFWWGDKLCLFAREEDVAGVVDSDPLDAGRTAQRPTLHERHLPRDHDVSRGTDGSA